MDPWFDDLLDRKHDAKILYNFLKNRSAERSAILNSSGYVLNLDASWGHGKTFFLKRLQKTLQEEGHVAVYVNGWADDSSQEPLVSVISAIENEIAPFIEKSSAVDKAWSAAKKYGGHMLLAIGKGAIKRVIKKGIGDGLEEVIEIYENANSLNLIEEPESDGSSASDDAAGAVVEVIDKAMEIQILSHKERRNSIDLFKLNIERMIKNVGANGISPPLFVLIDELDRCRPTYAIHMLEQIKHLFDVSGMVFVIATDSDQLSHSINAVYGQNFDSRSYLRRFFDRRFQFDDPSKEKFISYLLKTSGIDVSKLSSPNNLSAEFVIAGAAEFFELSLRDIEQCFDRLHTFVTMWPHPTKIALPYLLPIIMLMHKAKFVELEEFVSGNANLQGRDDLWYYFTRSANFQREEGNRQVRMSAVARNMSAIAKESIIAIARRDYPSSQEDQWIHQQLLDEMNIMHNGRSYDPRTPPYSVLSQYLPMARKLGQLSEL